MNFTSMFQTLRTFLYGPKIEVPVIANEIMEEVQEQMETIVAEEVALAQQPSKAVQLIQDSETAGTDLPLLGLIEPYSLIRLADGALGWKTRGTNPAGQIFVSIKDRPEVHALPSDTPVTLVMSPSVLAANMVNQMTKPKDKTKVHVKLYAVNQGCEALLNYLTYYFPKNKPSRLHLNKIHDAKAIRFYYLLTDIIRRSTKNLALLTMLHKEIPWFLDADVNKAADQLTAIVIELEKHPAVLERIAVKAGVISAR